MGENAASAMRGAREYEDIAGYRVIRRLGGGGMGEVFEVAHPRLPRHDALKLLHPSIGTDPLYKARFDREAYVLAQLNHRNIIHLYDRGEHRGRLWIATEYVRGSDTHRILAERGPMPLPVATAIADGAAAGLDYAYRHAKITHRDIKPANILVEFGDDGAPTVKLADFGIAKAAGETGGAVGVTSTGVTVGTMSYMSPEAFDNRELDNRADLYSLACTVFELLTGSPPFPGDSPAAVISAHLHQPVPKITSRAPYLPSNLDLVFRKALAKNPADRYDTCAEFVEGLRGRVPVGAEPASTAELAASERPEATWSSGTAAAPQTRAESLAWSSAQGPWPSEAPTAGPPTAREELASAQRSPRRSRKVPLIAAALLVVIALAVGSFFLFGTSVPGSDRALNATSVSLVNLQGTDEASSNIEHVLTGDQPAWRTDYYRSGPGFGGLKSGVGLLITLDRDATVKSGVITSPSAGSTVQVRTATSSAVDSLDQTSVVWDGKLDDGDTTFDTNGAESSRYVLLWITGLAQSSNGWSTTIDQVRLRGN